MAPHEQSINNSIPAHLLRKPDATTTTTTTTTNHHKHGTDVEWTGVVTNKRLLSYMRACPNGIKFGKLRVAMGMRETQHPELMSMLAKLKNEGAVRFDGKRWLAC